MQFNKFQFYLIWCKISKFKKFLNESRSSRKIEGFQALNGTNKSISTVFKVQSICIINFSYCVILVTDMRMKKFRFMQNRNLSETINEIPKHVFILSFFTSNTCIKILFPDFEFIFSLSSKKFLTKISPRTIEVNKILAITQWYVIMGIN